MSERFQTGDVVQLKAGGKHWTVEDVSDLGVRCRDDKGNSQVFAPGVLKKYERRKLVFNTV